MPSAYDPIKENLLYPLDNPDFALRQAMADVGVNPYSGNPYARAVARLGRSSAASYLTQMAADNTQYDTGPYAVTNQGAGGRGSAVAFSDYLRNALTAPGNTGKYPGRSEYGMGGEFGHQANVANASAFLAPEAGRGNVINKIRQYQRDLAAGTANASTVNPFLATLAERLQAGDGRGTAQFLTDLYAPYMAPSMATAYGRMLAGTSEQAIRQMANQPLTTPNDIWTYLLGY